VGKKFATEETSPAAATHTTSALRFFVEVQNAEPQNFEIQIVDLECRITVCITLPNQT
jgi:hypothetical protein